MRVRCFECGKSVSSEVPDDTVVRAMVICPECLAHADQTALEEVFRTITVGRVRAQRLARTEGES